MKLILSLVLCLFQLMGQEFNGMSGVIGTFPHYAVGAEWSTTIYMDLAGVGTNIDKTKRTTCTYHLEFYNTAGFKLYTHKVSYSSDYSFRSNTLKLDVPDFQHGQLAYGPVIIRTDCSEDYPIKMGELIFSQKTGNVTNDGTISFLRYQSENSSLIDPSKYQYGYAVYNPSENAKAIFMTVYDTKNKNQIAKNVLVDTLAGHQQKIFLLSDIYPPINGKSGLFVVYFDSQPYDGLYSEIMFVSLKFNKSGLFSTSPMYNSYVY